MADRDFLDKLARELTDRGKLIEAGWVSFRKLCIHEKAPAIQLEEMRMAFFAGAQHLFGSITAIIDPGDDREPTPDDLRRMDLINQELLTFIDEFKTRMAAQRKPNG